MTGSADQYEPAGSGLAGQVALITGAAGGIGAATARRLAAEGVRLSLLDMDAQRLRALADELGEHVVWVAGDVAEEHDVERAVNAAVETFGHIDLHHLNAGISGSFARLPDMTVEDFDRAMAVNMRGTFLGLRTAFRHYERQGTGGAIVLTASIASLRGSDDLIAYQASKHGVVGLLRGAAMYGGPIGVRVNAVAPGIVPTELFAANATATGGADDMVRRAATAPLRRAGTPDEIAGVVTFLLGRDSSYMTSEVVSVDGGAAAVSTVRPSGGAGAWDTTAVDQRLHGDSGEGSS